VIPIGKLKNITLDLDGVCTTTNFEVMDMVDESIPFPTLLGIDWAFENQTIINLKTRKMIFEAGNFSLVAPSDPIYCQQYVEPVHDIFLWDDVNKLYRMRERKTMSTQLQMEYLVRGVSIQICQIRILE
jgi:hypothetical protein